MARVAPPRIRPAPTSRRDRSRAADVLLTIVRRPPPAFQALGAYAVGIVLLDGGCVPGRLEAMPVLFPSTCRLSCPCRRRRTGLCRGGS
jgi:hypothetical protein